MKPLTILLALAAALAAQTQPSAVSDYWQFWAVEHHVSGLEADFPYPPMRVHLPDGGMQDNEVLPDTFARVARLTPAQVRALIKLARAYKLHQERPGALRRFWNWFTGHHAS